MIFITTSGRAGNVRTLENLSKKLINRTVLVIQEKESEKYEKAYHHYLDHGISFLRLPKEIKTLEPTRAWVWHHIMQNGFDKFILLDDDLIFSRRIPTDKTRLQTIPPKETNRMFELLYSMLDDYAHVGISERAGNNREPKNFRYVSRCVRVLGYNRKLIPVNKLKFGRIICMSDYDMTLQLLRLGLPNAISFEYAQDQGGSNAAGGCSVYRSPEVLADSAKKLKKLHEDFVSLTWKKTKGGWFKGRVENNKRLDVRIQWKQAYQDGGPINKNSLHRRSEAV